MLRRLLSDSAWYFVAAGLRAAGPFLLLPVLTRTVGAGDFGLYAIFQVLVWLAIPLAGVNTHSAIMRQRVDGDGHAFARYVGSCFRILLVSASLLFVLAYAAAPAVERLTGFPASLWLYYPLIAVGQYLISVRLVVWQMDRKPRRYGALAVVQTLGFLTLAIGLVTATSLGWRSIVYAQAIVYSVLAAFAVASLRRDGHLGMQGHRDDIRAALAYSLPLVPYSVLTWVLSAADRVMLKNMLGLDATGVYAAGHQIGLAVMVVQMAANQAWVPWFFGQLKADSDAARLTVVRMTYGYFVLLAAAGAVIALLAGWIVSVFLGPDFHSSVEVVPWIALSCVFNGFYVNFGNYFFYLRRTALLAGVMFLAALTNVLLNASLIPRLGIEGAAMASAAAYFVGFVVLFAPLANAVPMPWRAALTRKSH